MQGAFLDRAVARLRAIETPGYERVTGERMFEPIASNIVAVAEFGRRIDLTLFTTGWHCASERAIKFPRIKLEEALPKRGTFLSIHIPESGKAVCAGARSPEACVFGVQYVRYWLLWSGVCVAVDRFRVVNCVYNFPTTLPLDLRRVQHEMDRLDTTADREKGSCVMYRPNADDTLVFLIFTHHIVITGSRDINNYAGVVDRLRATLRKCTLSPDSARARAALSGADAGAGMGSQMQAPQAHRQNQRSRDAPFASLVDKGTAARGEGYVQGRPTVDYVREHMRTQYSRALGDPSQRLALMQSVSPAAAQYRERALGISSAPASALALPSRLRGGRGARAGGRGRATGGAGRGRTRTAPAAPTERITNVSEPFKYSASSSSSSNSSSNSSSAEQETFKRPMLPSERFDPLRHALRHPPEATSAATPAAPSAILSDCTKLAASMAAVGNPASTSSTTLPSDPHWPPNAALDQALAEKTQSALL